MITITKKVIYYFLILDFYSSNNDNDYSDIQNKNYEDSKRDDSFIEEVTDKEIGINKAIDILLENDE